MVLYAREARGRKGAVQGSQMGPLGGPIAGLAGVVLFIQAAGLAALRRVSRDDCMCRPAFQSWALGPALARRYRPETSCRSPLVLFLKTVRYARHAPPPHTQEKGRPGIGLCGNWACVTSKRNGGIRTTHKAAQSHRQVARHEPITSFSIVLRAEVKLPLRSNTREYGRFLFPLSFPPPLISGC